MDEYSGDIKAVQESYDRCCRSGDFFGTFYDIFLAKSPEIPPLFEDTDFEVQKEVIKTSVGLMILIAPLVEVARRHSRNGLNIRPEWYELWLDALCEALRKHDTEFTPELEAKWRANMRLGIEFMTSMYFPSRLFVCSR